MPSLSREIPKFISATMSREEVPKAALKISQSQWKMLLERIASREASKAEKAMIDPAKEKMTNFIMNMQPPSTRMMGRLEEPIMEGGEQIGVRPKDYPYGEAALRYLKGLREGSTLRPSRFTPPPVDQLTGTPGGIQYERKMWRPMQGITQSADRSMGAAQAVERELPKPKVMPQTPENAEFINKAGDLKVRGQKVLESIQRDTKTREAPSEELLKMGMLGDQLWKYIGGQRTLTGKFWDALRKGSRGRTPVDTRDYFIRSFLRWTADKEGYAKRFPREAKSLDAIWGKFQEDFGADLVE